MVKKITKNGKEYFQCEECLMFYNDQVWAEKCQKWCAENKTCNIDIISHSVKE